MCLCHNNLCCAWDSRDCDSWNCYELRFLAQIYRGVSELRPDSCSEEQQSREEQAWASEALRRSGLAQLGMVQVSASREGRMPIFQLCPVHTEPDWWISSEKKSIKPLQKMCKQPLKVKLTLPGVVTSLQNGQTWEKYPDIKVWRFLFQLSQLKSRWRIVVIPVRSKMLSMKAWLSGLHGTAALCCLDLDLPVSPYYLTQVKLVPSKWK